jgi:glycosyltransferase involved in cell wall biosynthesis
MNLMTINDLPAPATTREGWPWNAGTPEFQNIDRPPRVTIITPSYNQGHYIEETIRSVLLQGYPNLEYIVVDGGSTDNTIEILKKYNTYLRWISEPDKGQTDAINKGLKMSAGEIFAYLNSDDIYLPGAIQEVVAMFLRYPDIDMVYGNIVHIGRESETIEKYQTKPINISTILSFNLYVPQPAVFLRRSVIDDTGYFDDSLDLAMDYDYWIRVLRHHKAGYIDRDLAAARLYPEAKSSSLDMNYRKDLLKIHMKFFSDDVPPELAKLEKKGLGRIYLNSGRVYLGHFMTGDAREDLLLSLKTYPANFIDLTALTALVLSFSGERITKGFIRLKRNLLKMNFY